MNFVASAFQDDSGQTSAMRVALLLVVGGFVFNWCYLTIITKVPQPPDMQQVALILGAFHFKNEQAKTEAAAPKPPTP